MAIDAELRPPQSTLNCTKSSAEICRERSWRVGTRLAGDEGRGVEIIEITAVGEDHIFAKTVLFDGKKPTWAREASWCLTCRDWKEVSIGV
jgi:hypothetical protein